ncbi:Cytochrome b561 domain-containing protein 1 [Larimichthys crocea]|uniref:ascorbate ferrireductase (transmembrane) n=1 Tax=Larimichthys crocea TaxID=215358 RepID=A0A6G0J334_LARCR|nr:Cytochrome b561 domain-containing protein 1 [Larimichthys crocea]
MRSADVEYSPVGEGLGMREFWLYVWLRRVAVIAAHVTGMGLTLIISLLSRPGTSLFSWHPVCMSFAYCLCMTEGILLFSAEGSPFCFKSRKGKVRLHWFCQALVLISAATGLGFMVASKSVSELPHLVTWHSLLGICTLAATILQASCGLCVVCPKLAALFLCAEAQAVPRHLRPGGLPAGHSDCGVSYVLRLVSGHGERGGLVGLPPAAPFPALVVMNQITNAYLPRKKITS